jgi:thiol-disulfide isomerase/thioredoxin
MIFLSSSHLRRAAVALAFWSGVLASATFASEAPTRCEDEPYVVKIHADWCGSCRAIQPAWEDLESSVGEKATLITLDVTDRKAADRSRSVADALGLTEFFLDYGRQTGTVGVIRCDTLEPVAILRAESDLARYREAIDQAARTN